VYNRGVKRKEDNAFVTSLLKKVEQRTSNAVKHWEEVIDPSKRPKSASSGDKRHLTEKRKYLDESKNRARDNYLTHVQQQRIEDITIQSQIQQENLVTKYNHKIEDILQEKSALEHQNKVLTHKISKLEEEIQSLRYTVDLLRNKVEKTTNREIENQTKLKVFQQFEPLFAVLQKTFNFDSPQQVVKRMEMLENAQAESYTQLLEAQEQKNQSEKMIEKLKKDFDLKLRDKQSQGSEERSRVRIC